MAKKGTFITLNQEANSFTCPNTLFHLSGNQVKEVGTSIKSSFFVKRGLRSGHLKEVSEVEFKKYTENEAKYSAKNAKDLSQKEYIEGLKEQLSEANEKIEAQDKIIEANDAIVQGLNEKIEELEEEKEDDGSVDFSEMGNMNEIKKYLEDNYELSDDDISKMNDLSRADLEDFANKIVSDNEEE